jgi:ribosome-binding ATPase YchF (GTP1/OBG family)
MLNEIKSAVTANSEALKEMKAEKVEKVEKVVPVEKKIEQKMSQKDDVKDIKIQEMSDKIKQLESKINEPARATVRTVEMSQQEFVDKDAAFLEVLRQLN